MAKTGYEYAQARVSIDLEKRFFLPSKKFFDFFKKI